LNLKKPPKNNVDINSTADNEEDGCPDPALVLEINIRYLMSFDNFSNLSLLIIIAPINI